MEKMGSQNFDAEVLDFLRSEIENPPTVDELASLVESELTAAEMYLAAQVVIDQSNPAEKQWLLSLQQSLNLQPELVTEMEKEVA